MTHRPEAAVADARVGLCGSCAHGAPVTSSRGSTFWRCERAADDRRFPKYPRLPVVECSGYARVPADPTRAEVV